MQTARHWWILLALACSHSTVRAPDAAPYEAEVDVRGFREQHHRVMAEALARGAAGGAEALDSPHCKSQITSPPRGALWTASYLVVQWRMCQSDEADAASLTVRLDGQNVMQGRPGVGRFTMHGIGNGPHTLEVVATDGAGSTLDLGPLLHLTFEVERGESLLGAMSKRVQAGDFRHLDSLSPPAGMALNEEDGADGQETEGSGVACADEDVTLVTAAINIGRRHGNISFEDDYIGNLRHILSLRCPTIVFLQAQYVPLIEPFLHERAEIRVKEIRDLEAFPHAAAIDALRNSDTWAGRRKAYNPATMEHYNALVMSKVYWLAQMAREEPFATRSLLWIDAGLCARFVAPPLQLADVAAARDAPGVAADSGGAFLVYAMHESYHDGFDVHGFPQAAHQHFGGGSPAHLLRGNIFGGSPAAIAAAAAQLDQVLTETLAAGYMGTEESALTLACARTPGLCHIISVSDNHLETEMPCNMFVRASASGARVSLTFPPSATGSDSPPLFAEAFFVAAAVSNFELGRDGALCITWSAGGGGRVCSEESTAVVVSEMVEVGEVAVRAELVGLDGLPLASSGGQGRLVSLLQASPEHVDYEDDWFDSRASIGAVLHARQRAGVGVVVWGASGGGGHLVAQDLVSGGYTGTIKVFDWHGEAGDSTSDRDSQASCTGTAEACGAGDRRGHLNSQVEWRAMVRAGGLDFVYLCGHGESEDLGTVLSLWFDHQGEDGAGALLAGCGYYDVWAPDGLLVYAVKTAVDSFAKARGLRLQVTQELRHRSWVLQSAAAKPST